MSSRKQKTLEIVELPAPDHGDITCPSCKSRDIIRINSFLRKIKASGTKTARKFVEFESIHLRCNGCGIIFPLERDGIIPGLSATADVLENVLLYYFEFGNSAAKVKKLMETFYSVRLSRATILKWARIHGKDYCDRNQLEFDRNFETSSGHLAMDGTFPRFDFVPGEKSPPGDGGKKARVPWLRLTALPGGTLLAIWEEVRTSKK